MTKNRYSVGDKVLVSRDESGENHEPGNVIDSYELIIGEERRPVVVIEFEDGERKYMTATTPNVLPVEPEEDESEEGAEDASVVEATIGVEANSNGAVTVEDDEAGSP
jgi:hypothetical protein